MTNEPHPPPQQSVEEAEKVANEIGNRCDVCDVTTMARFILEREANLKAQVKAITEDRDRFKDALIAVQKSNWSMIRKEPREVQRMLADKADMLVANALNQPTKERIEL